MMKNNKILLYGTIVVILALAGIYLFVLSKPESPIAPSPEGRITVKFHGGAFATIAECGDKNYITNTADYIIQGTVEKVKGKCICKENTTQILTYTEIKIEKYIKGVPFRTNKLQIIIPGGCCVIKEKGCYGNIGEEICALVEDSPILHEGKRVILYLKKVPKEFREFGEEFSIVCSKAGVEEISGECKDECSPEGAKKCVSILSPEGETIGYTICGNYDNDACLEWSNIFTCPEGTVCVNGSCKILPAKGNIKNENLYHNREVFLISDKNWKDILTFLPVTVWTENNRVYKYPYLIYHEEISEAPNSQVSFDADSIIHFIQRYNSSKITIIGDIPQELNNLLITELGFTRNQIQKISVNKSLMYWKFFNNIIYVEDDYESALLASTYASLHNTPLIIQNSSLDSPTTFREKNIILVGSVSCPLGGTCNKRYNLEELKRKYVEETNTDKIILVNPNDLNIFVNESFRTEKSSSIISKLYTKTSLVAPILASAKHELIISTTSTNYAKVNSFVKNQTNNFQSMHYLTIFASPDAIQMTGGGGFDRFATDKIYATNNDGFQTLAVGRIFGISTSDISSYVATDIFYKELPRTNIFSVLFTGGVSPEVEYEAKATEKLLSAIGFVDESIFTNSTIENFNYTNKFYINFFGHGYSQGWMYALSTGELQRRKIWLESPLVYGEACLTCAYDLIPKGRKGELFCSNIIRRGALAYIGNIAEAGEGGNSKNFLERLVRGKSIGDALKEANNLYFVFLRELNTVEVLIGDPTITLDFKNPHIDTMSVSETGIDDSKIIQISAHRNSSTTAYFGEYVAFSYPPVYIYRFNYSGILNFTKVELVQDGNTYIVDNLESCSFGSYPNFFEVYPDTGIDEGGKKGCKEYVEFPNSSISINMRILKYFDQNYLIIDDHWGNRGMQSLSNNHQIKIFLKKEGRK